jgi:hypothetical protein
MQSEKSLYSNNILGIVPSSSNEYGIELSDKYNIELNTTSSYGKRNSIMKHFQKIVNKFDGLNIEKRGIERVLPEDRNDSTIMNTAMIWVRNRFIF